jgi:hypothetical protein
MARGIYLMAARASPVSATLFIWVRTVTMSASGIKAKNGRATPAQRVSAAFAAPGESECSRE